MAFWGVKLGPSFLFFFSLFFLQKKVFKKSEKRPKLPFWVKTWSNYAAQHTWTKFWLNLGPSFDSTFLTLFGLCFPFFLCYFYSMFSKDLHFESPPPKKIGTLFVNGTALTEKKMVRFSVFLFFCVFAVSVFGRFLRGMINNQTKQPRKETRPQDANNRTT